MAISLIASPDYFSPAYNPLKFIYNSTNKNNDGFRYIFDVYESGTANRIARYKVFPRYLDGYGEVDLSRLLQTYVSYDFNLGTTEDATAPNSFYKYDVKVGEEYVTVFNYTSSLTNNGGYVKITVTHSFQVGDRVVIAQDDSGVANPNLEGLFIVTAINGTTDFTVNSLWSEVSDATINGSVRYSDNRKTVTANIATANNQYAYNAAFGHNEWVGYSDGNWIMTSTADLFLTNCPQRTMYITPDQELFFNLCTNGVTTGRIYFQNDSGTTGYYVANASGFVYQANVGASAVPSTFTVGSAPIITATTLYYDVWYADNAGVRKSDIWRINIDRRCTINDYQIIFLDRKGSFGSFAFQLKAYENGNVERKNYDQVIAGSVTSSQWGYTSVEDGQRNYAVNVEKSLQLNTNWMNEEMAAYFEELVTSPICFLYDGTTAQPVIVTDTSFEVEKERNKRKIRKTITVKYANQNKVNG